VKFTNSVNANVVAAFTSTMKIERMGQSTVVINASQVRGVGSAALNPALPDATVTNYKAFGNIAAATLASQYLRSVRLSITNVSTLGIEAFRNFNTASLVTSVTGVTVAGGLLTDVSGMAVANPEPGTVFDAHGSSGTFFDHAHDAAGLHPVTDPQHTHAVGSLSNSLGADTYTVDWMIIHI